MPSLRLLAASQRQESSSRDDQVRRAMMADLGTIRIEELPLDDTHKSHVVPPRARRAPVIIEHTEALKEYLTLAKTGMNDAEAMAVRDLDDLGGPSVYRPTLDAGPARNLPENRRLNPANFRGMQTSQNGIVIPPGAQIRRFPSGRAADEPGPATTRTDIANEEAPSAANQAPTGSRATRIEPSNAANLSLPPHLRAKSTQNALTATPSNVITAPKSASGTPSGAQEMEKQGLKDSTKQSGTRDQNSSKNEIMIYWTGQCKALAQGKDRDVSIDLKIIKSAEHANGHPVFIMTCPGVFTETHSMNEYNLDFHKNHLCIIGFVASESGALTRYSLKFYDTETAIEFTRRAALLQKVMGYLSKVAAPQDEMQMGNTTTVDSAAVNATPVVKATPAVQTSPPVERNEAPKNARQSGTPDEAVSIKKSHDEEMMTNAFEKLSLSNIKKADMYKADRPPRVQYSSEQLFERRYAAEVPDGIKDVKIPLAEPRRLPPHMQQNQQSRAPQPSRDTAKLVDWISGTNKTQTSTDGISKISMPGLSEAISYHKAVATTAQSSAGAQMPNKDSTESRLEKEIDSKAENKAESAVEIEATEVSKNNIDIDIDTKIQAGSSNEKMSIDNTHVPGKKALESSVIPMESVNPVVADAHIRNALENVLSEESLIPMETAGSDNVGALSTASNDSAVEFETSVKPELDANIADREDDIVPEMIAQFAPTPAPASSSFETPAIAPAVQPDPGYGQSAQTGYAIPTGISLPQMMTPQMNYTTQMQPQMHPHTMIPGMFPATGVVHAITVTYHISHPNPSEGFNMNGQPPQSGGIFSPRAEPFQPSIQGQISRQQTTDQPRMRRGLGDSMFATGYTAAKFPGSFTGATPE
ncbi:hypothetical protein CORC01_05595 [Colletotrichum orchidophilum]|uniref:Uncharacterized protein n=1 Tax=Colletotrichum orchidophilum TaxID=1209926 RepID=A0A1G4BCQ5_9PEZI|nr:uncharacterized protein CORC01_05595 [Colletotrichum orchidophilum]OHE99102.1 hypothetical protein CORC01_05595 [Colletotrichum orchidophilum]